MALQRDTKTGYVGRWDVASAGHPQGAFKNRSAPAALDGSYIEKDWANDWDGFFSSLIEAQGGVTPDGVVDEVGASQYFDQLNAIITAAVEGASQIESGDYIPSADDSGMLARGFTLAGIPNLVEAVYSYGAFAAFGTALPAGNKGGVAVNSVTGDVFTTGVTVNDVYKLDAGAGAWAVLETYAGTAPGAIAVDETNGDVWVIDVTENQLYLLPGGSGIWSQIGTISGTTNVVDIAFNQTTRDLWLVADDSAGPPVVYKLAFGTTTFSPTGSYPGENGTSIGINSSNGDVFVRDKVDTTAVTTHQTDQIYVLTDGDEFAGVFRQIQKVNFPGKQLISIAVDSSTGDLLITDSTSSSIFWRSPLGTERFIAEQTLVATFIGKIVIDESDSSVIISDLINDEPVRSTRTETTPAVKWWVKT